MDETKQTPDGIKKTPLEKFIDSKFAGILYIISWALVIGGILLAIIGNEHEDLIQIGILVSILSLVVAIHMSFLRQNVKTFQSHMEHLIDRVGLVENGINETKVELNKARKDVTKLMLESSRKGNFEKIPFDQAVKDIIKVLDTITTIYNVRLPQYSDPDLDGQVQLWREALLKRVVQMNNTIKIHEIICDKSEYIDDARKFINKVESTREEKKQAGDNDSYLSTYKPVQIEEGKSLFGKNFLILVSNGGIDRNWIYWGWDEKGLRPKTKNYKIFRSSDQDLIEDYTQRFTSWHEDLPVLR